MSGSQGPFSSVYYLPQIYFMIKVVCSSLCIIILDTKTGKSEGAYALFFKDITWNCTHYFYLHLLKKRFVTWSPHIAAREASKCLSCGWPCMFVNKTGKNDRYWETANISATGMLFNFFP